MISILIIDCGTDQVWQLFEVQRVNKWHMCMYACLYVYVSKLSMYIYVYTLFVL